VNKCLNLNLNQEEEALLCYSGDPPHISPEIPISLALRLRENVQRCACAFFPHKVLALR
jgi:hypothetical protein